METQRISTMVRAFHTGTVAEAAAPDWDGYVPGCAGVHRGHPSRRGCVPHV
jgi:hypothetical protein